MLEAEEVSHKKGMSCEVVPLQDPEPPRTWGWQGVAPGSDFCQRFCFDHEVSNNRSHVELWTTGVTFSHLTLAGRASATGANDQFHHPFSVVCQNHPELQL